MQATTVREALRASLAGTFGTILSVLPRLIVFAVALAVGWVLSTLLARATIAVLGAVRFDEMARRSGLAGFIQQMGVREDPTSVVASAGKWLVRLTTLVVAFDAVGLPAGSGVLHQLLLWLPNLAVAIVALIIGGLAATALSRLMQGFAAGAGLPNPQVLATATSVAVWAFAVVVAVGQLGIATPVVNLGLLGVVGGIALAAGLAFGWAGRDRAAQLLSLLDGRHVSAPDAAGRSSPSVATDGIAATTTCDPPASPVTATGGSASSSAAAAAADVLTSSPAANVSTSAPPVDTPVAMPTPGASDDPSLPERDVSAPEPEVSMPELEVSAPEPEVSVPELEVSVLEVSTPEFEVSTPEFEVSSAVLDGPTRELQAAALVLDQSAPELVLFPEDEPIREPARVVPFEETWIPRSGSDRRRIARPGPDRRTSVA